MKGKIVFSCLLDLFLCSVTVTGAVKKSLFEDLVDCATDEADKTMKTVRSKVIHVHVYVHVIDCFQYIKIQFGSES